MRKPKQSKFLPKNPGKYVGDVDNIIARSGWEKEVFKWADLNTKILRWSSEEIIIPYYDPVQRKMRRYFPDVWIELNSSPTPKKFLIEVKPIPHSKMPKSLKKKAGVINALNYVNNAAKWIAAKKYASSKGWEFILLCKDSDGKFVVRQDLLESAIHDAQHNLLV